MNISLKLTAKKKTELSKALDLIEEHVKKVSPHWHKLTPEQRVEILEKSPLFSRFLSIASFGK